MVALMRTRVPAAFDRARPEDAVLLSSLPAVVVNEEGRADEESAAGASLSAVEAADTEDEAGASTGPASSDADSSSVDVTSTTSAQSRSREGGYLPSPASEQDSYLNDGSRSSRAVGRDHEWEQGFVTAGGCLLLHMLEQRSMD